MDNAWQPQDAAAAAAPSSDMNGVEDYGRGYDSAPRRSSRSRSPGDRGRGGGGAPIVENPGNNLHVSGLSSKCDNRELEAAFAKVGRVAKAQVVYDPHTRESRGFGFVTMETPEEADAAVTALNNAELLGKALTVAKAKRGRARTPTPGRYHGPTKRRTHDRPYDPRPYDGRYSRDRGDRDYDRRDDRRDRDRGERGERAGRYDDYRGGGGGRGGGRDYDRGGDRGDRYRDYDRADRGGDRGERGSYRGRS